MRLPVVNRSHGHLEVDSKYLLQVGFYSRFPVISLLIDRSIYIISLTELSLKFIVMKILSPFFNIKLAAFVITAAATVTLTSPASEVGITDLFRNKAEALVPFKECAPLREAKFTSPVDGESNAWRRAVTKIGSRLSIALKSGRWERPDANELNNIWLSYNQDWSQVDTNGKSLRFTYEFDDSSRGAGCVFRFGASQDSRESHSGNYALTLVYGEKSCVFSVNGQKTAGELPFAIGVGAKVTVDLYPNNTAAITINDIMVLSDQQVDVDENYVTLALVDTTNQKVAPPRVLNLRNFEVSLGD